MDNKKKIVVIHVSGGVAYIAKCPRGVNVEIVDFDDAEAGATKKGEL